MSWTLLPTDYTDAVWSGLKKYTQVDNSDGTVSFQDVTAYTNKEKSFFGAADANRMNEALNTIMSMVESGTDLYEAFQTYFDTQKTLFLSEGNDVIEAARANANTKYNSFSDDLDELKSSGDTALAKIESDYASQMSTYESTQKAAFDAWFAEIKGQLSEDVAGSLQNEIDELDSRLSNMEYMVIDNDITAPLVVDSDTTLLTDDLGYAIVADWKLEIA